MKKIILSFFILTAGFPIQAQTLRHCASNEVLQRQIAADPSIKERALSLENYTKAYINSIKNSNYLRVAATDSTYASPAINIVVHVVYNTNEENISDAQVQSQIAILNADYQRLNADTTQTPIPFRPFAGKMNISFQLAGVDSSGKPTSGIVRKKTDSASFSDDDGVKKPSAGGDTAWPANQYLNIWVANLSNNFLGYAQFPYTNSPQTDGIVIHYKAFGNMGTATKPYNLGRTVTHEVGHWLNLIHVWGDATCGDDYVDDTPTQHGDHNGQCPLFPDTANNAPCANKPNGDMFMDYMDYTNDSCMNMFSKGQVARMEAALSYYPMRKSALSAKTITSANTIKKYAEGISFFPNPSNGDITINYNLKDTQNLIVNVFNLLGKQLYSTTYYNRQQGSEHLTLPAFADGIYFIRCATEQQVYTQKLLLKK